ncbi:MAG: hypothetical protein EPO08_05145 [Rhodospirillaceae bacterium]|nr:MAG: hypothetical protein EPO08_05145 [Rhodospirillaceae bacterium]
MVATMENPPPATAPLSNRQVDTIRGQYHKFMLIPLIEQHSRWFDGGLISIAVEARALGDSPERMARGPSIHVFNAERNEEYIRFDVFGKVLHYHYILNDVNHNILWGYDPDTNGPMIPWVIAALRDRLPTMLRRAGAHALAVEVEEQGWDSSILPEVEQAASKALAPREDDLIRAKEGMDWMYRWQKVHPQFNTVEEGQY